MRLNLLSNCGISNKNIIMYKVMNVEKLNILGTGYAMTLVTIVFVLH